MRSANTSIADAVTYKSAVRLTVADARVAMLKRQVEVAYFECREGDLEDLHDDLTSAEWFQRRTRERMA